jgi:hypothetical protein
MPTPEETDLTVRAAVYDSVMSRSKPFTARAAGRVYFGNCIWDALGIPAMLACDGRVETSCGCCGEAMSMSVEGRALQASEGLVHFAIPARRWWEDIVYS